MADTIKWQWVVGRCKILFIWENISSFTKGRCILLHPYAWNSRGHRTQPSITMTPITMTTSMNVKKRPWDEALACPWRECRTFSWAGNRSRDKELQTGWQEWSNPVLSGKRAGAVSAIPLGLGVKGWVSAHVMYLPRGFCERKSSIISDIPAVNQYNTQNQQCQPSATPREGRKGDLAQPGVPCKGERKPLLIMSVGTNMLSGLMPPPVLTGI